MYLQTSETVYCLKRTQFGQLILRKINEIVATRCQSLRLKCTKFDFSWGSALNPTRGAYSTPSDPLAGFKGGYFKGEEGKGMRKKREWEGEKRKEGERGESGESRNVFIPTSSTESAFTRIV